MDQRKLTKVSKDISSLISYGGTPQILLDAFQQFLKGQEQFRIGYSLLPQENRPLE